MDDHEADRRSDGSQSRRKCHILLLALVSGLTPLALSLLLTIRTALGHQESLYNAGFEQGTSGWTESLWATFITVTAPVSSGNWAASLHQSGVRGQIHIYQDVDVTAGATYTLTGWVYKNEPAFRSVCLEIAWLDSAWPDSADCLLADGAFYRPITVGPTLAPPDATAARMRAVADIRTASPPSPVYLDELCLTSSMTPRLHLPLLFKGYPH